jgi:hypothetical protein
MSRMVDDFPDPILMRLGQEQSNGYCSVFQSSGRHKTVALLQLNYPDLVLYRSRNQHEFDTNSITKYLIRVAVNQISRQQDDL